MELTAEHLDTLRRAKACLEHPSLAARLMDVLASPLDRTMGRLPRKWSGLVQSATRKAIGKGLAVRRGDIKGRRISPPFRTAKDRGADLRPAGGAFGLAALPVELRSRRLIMLRSILPTSPGAKAKT